LSRAEGRRELWLEGKEEKGGKPRNRLPKIAHEKGTLDRPIFLRESSRQGDDEKVAIKIVNREERIVCR